MHWVISGFVVAGTPLRVVVATKDSANTNASTTPVKTHWWLGFSPSTAPPTT